MHSLSYVHILTSTFYFVFNLEYLWNESRKPESVQCCLKGVGIESYRQDECGGRNTRNKTVQMGTFKFCVLHCALNMRS